MIKWVMPSYETAAPGEAEALDVLSEALGGGSSSLLYRELVAGRKLAVAAGAYYNGSARDHGSFVVYAAPREGVSLETLKAAVDEVLASATEGAIDAAEVERARRRLEASTIYAQDSQATLARIFGTALVLDGTIEEVQTWPERIARVNAAAVTAAARGLEIDTSVTGYLRMPADIRG
ncbi:M16 family metallopeptidase [Methylobrevis pamukkalensis]|uniref:Peptidase M16 inactive domain protein n=1 Tax=Methylobrevis pamukkalensis TaxID=1439726 RepID=A0A1E3H5W6_9HYPH|nr:insulinase family protein [Methylobrevis pamukkalensis]ODN71729.1 Peptidase M16 inactive domain protein [Methylobrevis pamukkalensis]